MRRGGGSGRVRRRPSTRALRPRHPPRARHPLRSWRARRRRASPAASGCRGYRVARVRCRLHGESHLTAAVAVYERDRIGTRRRVRNPQRVGECALAFAVTVPTCSPPKKTFTSWPGLNPVPVSSTPVVASAPVSIDDRFSTSYRSPGAGFSVTVSSASPRTSPGASSPMRPGPWTRYTVCAPGTTSATVNEADPVPVADAVNAATSTPSNSTHTGTSAGRPSAARSTPSVSRAPDSLRGGAGTLAGARYSRTLSGRTSSA